MADGPVPPAPPPLLAAASGETAAAETFFGDRQAETTLWETHLRRIRSDLKWMSRLLVFALVALVIGAAGSVVNGVLVFIESSKHSRELPPKYGRVVVVASWKYNDVQGHRPDVNSVVILFPAQLKKKLGYCGSAHDDERFSFDYDHPDVHRGWIGVDGRCVFSRVKPGNYKLLIISANVTSTEVEKFTKELKQYFSEVVLGLNKVFLTDIVVHPGEETEINHDFGIKSF